EVDLESPFQMLVTTTSYNEYLGRMAVGRIRRGKIKLNDPITLIKLDGRKVASNATKLFNYQASNRLNVWKRRRAISSFSPGWKTFRSVKRWHPASSRKL